MAEPAIQQFRDRLAQVGAALDAARSPDELQRARNDIIGLFKQIEAQIAELTQVKDDIKPLVDRYKQLASAARAGAAAPDIGEKPVIHSDHIGASTFIEKGWSLLSLGDYAGSITALKKALELSPNDAQAESLLGWAQMLKEDYDDALMTFQKVLMREPANSLARINVGYICLKKRIFGEAIEHLSKAIRMANDKKATLYAHYYLGLVYLEREMFEDADTFFRKTLELGPNLIEAYYQLGRAQWFAGDQEGARATWGQGFQANKFNPWGKKCREVLTVVEAGGSPPAPGEGEA